MTVKPFGCIDITHDKKNENVNGQEFISERVSLRSKDLLEKNSEEVNDMIKKSFLPLPLRIVKFICQFVFIASAAVIFRLILDQGITQLIRTMPWWFITIICVSLGGWIALALMQGKKNREVLEGKSAEELYEKTNNAVQCINEELNIPKTAVDVDILTFCYKKNEDKISPKARGFAPEYFNSIFSAFVEGDNLYLADLEAKYAFPLSSLSSIKRVEKEYAFQCGTRTRTLMKEHTSNTKSEPTIMVGCSLSRTIFWSSNTTERCGVYISPAMSLKQ